MKKLNALLFSLLLFFMGTCVVSAQSPAQLEQPAKLILLNNFNPYEAVSVAEAAMRYEAAMVMAETKALTAGTLTATVLPKSFLDSGNHAMHAATYSRIMREETERLEGAAAQLHGAIIQAKIEKGIKQASVGARVTANPLGVVIPPNPRIRPAVTPLSEMMTRPSNLSTPSDKSPMGLHSGEEAAAEEELYLGHMREKLKEPYKGPGLPAVIQPTKGPGLPAVIQPAAQNLPAIINK